MTGGRCPMCGWVGNTRPEHYVDSVGLPAELGSYCPKRFIPDKNGRIRGVMSEKEYEVRYHA